MSIPIYVFESETYFVYQMEQSFIYVETMKTFNGFIEFVVGTVTMFTGPYGNKTWFDRSLLIVHIA